MNALRQGAKPLQGERFWLKEGQTDGNWARIFGMEEREDGVWLVRTFEDSRHLITYNPKRNRWEELGVES